MTLPILSALTDWFGGIDLTWIYTSVLFALAAMLAISVHESAHGLAAYWLGDDTAKRMGRISLNPLRHLDPIGLLMMVIVHFGWARPVPVNMYRMHRVKHPKVGMALSALAGPLSNLLLGLLFGLLYAVCFYAGKAPLQLMVQGYREPSGWLYWLTMLFQVSFVLNCNLAVFNLIPVSPLDGSKILAILLPERAYRRLMQYERYGFVILAVLLFTGLLDKPLEFLCSGLMNGILAAADPLARLLTGA